YEYVFVVLFFCFFFSSRRRHTRSKRDWSSDVCSSDLESFARCVRDGVPPLVTGHDALAAFDLARAAEQSWRTGRPVAVEPPAARSEERRVGKECRSRGSPDHEKKKRKAEQRERKQRRS